MTNSIQLIERATLSNSQINQLRKQGQVPAIVYGQDIGSISVIVDEKDIMSTIKRNPHVILNAAIPGNGNKIGDHLLVSDLAFQEGIEVLSDPSAMLIKITQANAEEAVVVPA